MFGDLLGVHDISVKKPSDAGHPDLYPAIARSDAIKARSGAENSQNGDEVETSAEDP